ncbi:UNVERIFIED_CONTAM: hypothetical protein GTU68_023016 [Idotea baltica]|nr:hypothetical protein [Idotea baltica]
MFTQAKYY